MTKINKTKLALLGATALFSATSAHAQVADTWGIGGNVLVTATNTAATTSLDAVNGGGATVSVDAANIADGFKNSISASAVGASASSSFTSLNNSGTGGEATLAIDGNVTVAAGNTAAVLNGNDVSTGATIVIGDSNSISLAAVGSSASVSASTTLTNVAGAEVGADEVFNYSIGGNLAVSSGSATGTTDPVSASIVGGNTGTVTLLLDTAGVVKADIQGGNGNSISTAGVGSSASASFTATVGGDGSILDGAAFDLSSGTNNVSATNAVTGTVAVGLTDAGFTTPQIEGGNANSISGAAVGSSASLSLASSTFDSGVISDFTATLNPVKVDSTNKADVAISSDGVAGTAAATVIDDGAISGAGNGNSISVSAVGSSGSVSYSNTVYSGANGAAGGTVGFDTITVNSTNSGSILNGTEVTTGAGIDGGSKNSISIAGVGASASQSLSVTDYTGAGITGVASSTGNITINGTNTGSVLVLGGLAVPNIDAGFSNSISAAAVGASASQAVSRTLVGAP